MHVLPLLAATALLAAVPATVAGPADARIIDSGHFTDSFTGDPSTVTASLRRAIPTSGSTSP